MTAVWIGLALVVGNCMGVALMALFFVGRRADAIKQVER